MQNLTVQSLKEHHLDDCAKILAKNFIISNPVYKKFNLPIDEIQINMRGKLVKALEIDQSFVLYEGEKLCGVYIQLDILDYVSYPSMPSHLKFFEINSKVDNAFLKEVNLTNVKRGEIIYGTISAIDLDFNSKGYGALLWWICIAISKAAGYKAYYCRCSNIISLRGMERIGAVVINKYSLVDGDLNETFWFLKMDLTKNVISYSNLIKKIKNKNLTKPPKSKL